MRLKKGLCLKRLDSLKISSIEYPLFTNLLTETPSLWHNLLCSKKTFRHSFCEIVNYLEIHHNL
jgi:hypothetical protein